MKSLLNYSAVTAKVKAMKSRFLTEEQFKELAFLPDVPSAVEYLRNFLPTGKYSRTIRDRICTAGTSKSS